MAVVVGSGSHQYEVAEGWGQLPPGYEWGTIGAVAVDKQERVWIYTRTDHPLMMFDKEGKFLRSWGEGEHKDAHGICFDDEENYFLADRSSQVVMKFTKDHKKLFEVGNRDQPSDTGYTDENRTVLRAAGPFHHVSDIAMASTGDFYVSDGYRNCRVHKFSADGKLLFSWGEPGTGPGEFRLVHCVWEHKGIVYVCDRDNDRIQLFTPQGEYIKEWGGFVSPCDIYVDENDLMYVAELQSRVTLLTLDGTVVTRIGSPEERKAEPGKFIGPHGIWADPHGNFYVCEVLDGKRIQKFVKV